MLPRMSRPELLDRAVRALGALDVRARGRRRRILQHEVGLLRRPGVDAIIVPDKAPGDDDVAIAERLLAAHRAAAASAPPASPDGPRDVWTFIVAGQERFAALLRDGDPRQLAAYLCNVSRHDASVGITQGDLEHERLLADRAYRDFVARLIHDKLVSLAEAVGALPVENPEQGEFGVSVRRSPAELVQRISERLGTDIAPPDVDGGLLKIDTGRGLVHERDANAIYTAHLLRRTAPGPAARICEIGGGSGRVAYWSHRLGLRDYTVVDLPHVNVVQGYYALKSLPADEVWLYGERAPKAGAPLLRFMPAHAIGELDGERFDLVLNQDSFPEMSESTVNEYLEWIAGCCDGSLLSINQESKPPYAGGLVHASVAELTAAAGHFELTHRFPYWLRRGYVVELYRIAP